MTFPYLRFCVSMLLPTREVLKKFYLLLFSRRPISLHEIKSILLNVLTRNYFACHADTAATITHITFSNPPYLEQTASWRFCFTESWVKRKHTGSTKDVLYYERYELHLVLVPSFLYCSSSSTTRWIASTSQAICLYVIGSCGQWLCPDDFKQLGSTLLLKCPMVRNENQLFATKRLISST